MSEEDDEGDPWAGMTATSEDAKGLAEDPLAVKTPGLPKQSSHLGAAGGMEIPRIQGVAGIVIDNSQADDAPSYVQSYSNQHVCEYTRHPQVPLMPL